MFGDSLDFVRLNRWMGAECSAVAMATNDEKFRNFRHSYSIMVK
jgi:hypothetical protein